MSASMEHSNLLINRAKTIAAMGMVERDYEGFNVGSAGIKKETFRVWRDEDNRIRCSCPEFQARFEQEPRFRCEHIFAVKFHLEPPDEEAAAAPGAAEQPEVESQAEVVAMPFVETLKELSQAVSPELIRQRIGWRDRAGREHEVDYVEWHVVADLLDRICPNWSHEVLNIKQIGDYVAITASITIQGVTRQGVGTGSAYEEKGIKKAEHDALKRAAVKFGIARELYRKEEDASPEKNGNAMNGNQQNLPRDPVAKTMADLVTPKQLVAIRAIANAQQVNAETECMEIFKCRPEELSRRAASALIDRLKSKTVEADEFRHAG
jgi:hypothetical protein